MQRFRWIAVLMALVLTVWSFGQAAIAAPLATGYENPAAQERIPLPSAQRDQAAQPLESTLVELLDLSLAAKQTHWNVNGPLFHSLHELLDEFAADYRDDADVVAERILEVGRTADGRPQIISEAAALPELPAGLIRDRDVVNLLSDRLNTVGSRLRDRITQLDDVDLVSQDVLIDVERTVAEHLWMLREFQQQQTGSIQETPSA